MISQVPVSERSELHKRLIDAGELTTCLTCAYFERDILGCNLATQKPPLEVIICGCPAWDDLIPF